jgi:hypothetical protein
MQNVTKLRIPLSIQPVLWIGDPYPDPTFHYDADSDPDLGSTGAVCAYPDPTE